MSVTRLLVEDDAPVLVELLRENRGLLARWQPRRPDGWFIRGAFQSCSVGYWLAESAQGPGLATAALREAVEVAFGELRLHRVQAETLLDNTRSQRVLERVCVRYGVAPDYLQIDGRWQTSALHRLITPTPELVLTG